MVIVFLIPDTFSFNLVVIVRKTFNQKRIKMCNVFLTLRPLPHFTNILFSVSCLVLKSDPAKLCRNVTIFTQNILSFFVVFFAKYSSNENVQFCRKPKCNNNNGCAEFGKRYSRTFFENYWQIYIGIESI